MERMLKERATGTLNQRFGYASTEALPRSCGDNDHANA